MPFLRHLVLHGIGDERIAHHADRMGAGDAEGRGQQALLLDPDGAGHLAVAVEGVIAGEHGPLPRIVAARPDRRYAGSRHRRRVVDDRGVADAHARYVGDGVVGAGRQLPDGDAEIAETSASHDMTPMMLCDA
jgi:hypothetical protein